MGKIRQSATQKNLIMSAAVRNNISSQRELAERIGMPISTFRRKMQIPWAFTLGELFSIDRNVRFTEEELLKLIRGK